MSQNPDRNKCPFDVLFDIIDDLQDIHKKTSDQHCAKNLQNKKCPACGELVTSTQTDCLLCGKKLSHTTNTINSLNT